MSNRTPIDFLRDILEHAEKIENFTAGLDDAGFIADEKTVYAVIRCFEVIGEAVKNIPDTVKRRYPQVPWARMAGMRDKLIHAYFGVDYETLWETVRKRIPEVKIVIREILQDIEAK